MSKKSSEDILPMSKAAMTVDVQNDNRTISNGIRDLCNRAESVLCSEAPTKRLRKSLLDTAASLLLLQNSVAEKIPTIVPSDFTSYAIKRIHTANDFAVMTAANTCAPRSNLRKRTIEVNGVTIPLPDDRRQYTAVEACNILINITKIKSNYKRLSLNRVVDAMLTYRVAATEDITPLIPVGRSAMFRVLEKIKVDPNVNWAVKGKPPILQNSSFSSSVHVFEKDIGRSIAKPDMKALLKSEKQRVARNKGNSTLIVASPTQRTINNYLALLPQLEPNRSKTTSVQQKSEARYIAERSIRNAVSHVMAVAVSHCQIGKPDTRIKSIQKATPGAIKLHDLIKAENKGLDIRPVLPMFISTTDDTTIFAFEGAVENKANECYIINKNDDTGTRSAFTKSTSSTDSLRGLRIRHTVTFNGVGNTAPFYLTIYGLSESELPSSTCPTGVYQLPIPGFCYGGNQNVSSSTVGYLIFIRSTKKDDEVSTDQLNHEIYRNIVFLPFVEQVRQHYLQNEGWEVGDEIDDDHIWVGWQVSTLTIHIQ